MAELSLNAIHILMKKTQLINDLRDAINTHTSLLSQGRYCPPDILESARSQVDIAAKIYADYSKEH
jgi:hypothetical protein